jgi:hypothetical protein
VQPFFLSQHCFIPQTNAAVTQPARLNNRLITNGRLENTEKFEASLNSVTTGL